MLVAAAAPFYRVLTFGKSKQWSRWFAYALFTWLTCASALYVVSDILIVHQVSFALICFGVAFKTRALMKERIKRSVNRQRLLNLAHAGSGMACFLDTLKDMTKLDGSFWINRLCNLAYRSVCLLLAARSAKRDRIALGLASRVSRLV